MGRRGGSDDSGRSGGWQDSPPETSNPFAALAALKDALPAGPEPAGPTPAESAAREGDATPRRAVLRLERKGRGGKEVTRIEQLDLPEEALAALAAEVKRALGCGGGVEGDAIVLQGDVRERCERWLRERGVRRISR